MKTLRTLCGFRSSFTMLSDDLHDFDANESSLWHVEQSDDVTSTPDALLNPTLIDHIFHLPVDVIQRIFSFLDVHELMMFKLVCKKSYLTYRKAVDRLEIHGANNPTASPIRLLHSLNHFASLKSFTFFDCNENSLPYLIRTFSSPRLSLTEFHYFINHWHSGDMNLLNQLLSSLSHHSDLKKLSLHKKTHTLMIHEFFSIDASVLPCLRSLSLDLPFSRLALTHQQMDGITELELTTYGLENFKCLEELFSEPNLDHWIGLQRLSLSFWATESITEHDLQPFFNSLYSYSNLKSLELAYFPEIQVMNPSLALNPFSNLTELGFIPSQFGYSNEWINLFKNLTHLEINSLRNTQFLTSLKDLVHLKHLKLHSGNIEGGEMNLKCLEGLIQLETLHLNFEKGVVVLPNFHTFLSLKNLVLKVMSLNHILVVGIHGLPLNHLEIHASNVPMVILDEEWTFSSKLRHLFIDEYNGYNCCRCFWESLVCSSSFLNLTSLDLSASSDSHLHFVGELIQLRYLSLRMSRVKLLPDSFCNLTQLRDFRLSLFSELRSLTFLAHCPSLQTLEIHDCPKLSHLPDSLFKFQFLYKITLENCPKLKSFKKKCKEIPCMVDLQYDQVWYS